MELTDALRSTASVREFTADPVDRDQLERILELARFAPSGGNRQPWAVVVLEDPAVRTAIRDLAQVTWREYIAQVRAGLVPFVVGPDGPQPLPAELDVSRRRELLGRLGGAEQCLLTTTDLTLFPAEFVARATVWEVEAGRIAER